MKPASATKMTGDTKQQSMKFGPITRLDAAQGAVLAEMKTLAFKKRAWELTPLPVGFWAQEGRWTLAVQDKFGGKGANALRQLVFHDLPLLPSTIEEWTDVTKVLTAPETFTALLAAIGHDETCQSCPIHTTAALVTNPKNSFLIYLGAFVSSQPLGHFRIKPWFLRHFEILSECALAAMRSGKSRKRMADDPDAKEWFKTQKNKRRVLADTTNLPPAPPSPPAYVLDPSISVSPNSCTIRRRERTEKLCQAKARSWAALPKQESTPPEADTEDPFSAPAPMVPHRTIQQIMSLDFILN